MGHGHGHGPEHGEGAPSQGRPPPSSGLQPRNLGVLSAIVAKPPPPAPPSQGLIEKVCLFFKQE